MKSSKAKAGFTIIEVVLVLAIAGLIFLIVFIAVPSLQRSRRDTQRKNDANRMVAQLEQYASNNGGRYPRGQAQVDSFVSEYLGEDFKDPSTGEDYDVFWAFRQPDDPGEVIYLTGYNCSLTASAGFTLVLIHQEQGRNYCQDAS